MVITKNNFEGFCEVFRKEPKDQVIREDSTGALMTAKSGKNDYSYIRNGDYDDKFLVLDLEKELMIYGNVTIAGNLTVTNSLYVHGDLIVGGNIYCKDPSKTISAETIQCSKDIIGGYIGADCSISCDNARVSGIIASDISAKGNIDSKTYVSAKSSIWARNIRAKYDITAEYDIEAIGNIKCNDGISCNELRVAGNINVKEGITTKGCIYCGGEIKFGKDFYVRAGVDTRNFEFSNIISCERISNTNNVFGEIHDISKAINFSTGELVINESFVGNKFVVGDDGNPVLMIPTIYSSRDVVINITDEVANCTDIDIANIVTTGKITINNNCSTGIIHAGGDIDIKKHVKQGSYIASDKGSIHINHLRVEYPSEDKSNYPLIVAKHGKIIIDQEDDYAKQNLGNNQL